MPPPAPKNYRRKCLLRKDLGRRAGARVVTPCVVRVYVNSDYFLFFLPRLTKRVTTLDDNTCRSKRESKAKNFEKKLETLLTKRTELV